MVLAGRLAPASMFPAGRPDLRTRYLHLASGLRVRAVECGDEGAPLILMLPGWGCSAYVFRENLAPLASAGFHAVAVDLKGHGLSDKPQSPPEYRLESMRLHVTEIIDALGSWVVMLSGLSMGGALAAHVAAADSSRVRSVVMVSPVGFSGVPGLPAFRALTPSRLTPVLTRVATREIIELLLWLVNGRLRTVTRKDVDEYWSPTQFPEFARAMRLLLHEFTWRVPFTRLPVPCLVMSGTRDRFLSSGAAESFRRVMPELRHIRIRDAGHVIYDEAAPIVNDEMIAFFRKVLATDGTGIGQALPYIPEQ